MNKPEAVSHKQMRILRLRYDALNREFGTLVVKKDYENYTARLKEMVEKALRNSGYDKQPVYVDRRARKQIPVDEFEVKGNVMRR